MGVGSSWSFATLMEMSKMRLKLPPAWALSEFIWLLVSNVRVKTLQSHLFSQTTLSSFKVEQRCGGHQRTTIIDEYWKGTEILTTLSPLGSNVRNPTRFNRSLQRKQDSEIITYFLPPPNHHHHHRQVCEKTKSKPRKIFDAVHKLWKTDAEVSNTKCRTCETDAAA